MPKINACTERMFANNTFVKIHVYLLAQMPLNSGHRYFLSEVGIRQTFKSWKLQSCPPFKHNAQCSEPTCSATKCGKNNINFFNPSHPDRIHPFAWSTFHTHYCVNFSKRLSLSVGNGKCRATKSCSALTTLSCGTERIKHGELLATSTNLSYFSAIGNISLYSVCATS